MRLRTSRLRRPGGAVGSTHRYSVYYAAGCACIREAVDGVVRQSTNFDPLKRWTKPWFNEWSGETTHTSSDISGRAATPATFYNMDVADSNDGFIGHGYKNFVLYPVHPRGKRSDVSGNSFSIWSK